MSGEMLFRWSADGSSANEQSDVEGVVNKFQIGKRLPRLASPALRRTSRPRSG